MVVFRAKVFTGAAVARLKKARKGVTTASDATVEQLTTIGKEKARVVVPKGTTGWLYSTIQSKVSQGTEGRIGKIFLKPTTVPVDGVHRYSEGNYPNFNLSRWMHTSPRATSHFGSSSRAKFMDTTRNYLNSVKKGVAKGRFKTIKIR